MSNEDDDVKREPRFAAQANKNVTPHDDDDSFDAMVCGILEQGNEEWWRRAPASVFIGYEPATLVAQITRELTPAEQGASRLDCRSAYYFTAQVAELVDGCFGPPAKYFTTASLMEFCSLSDQLASGFGTSIDALVAALCRRGLLEPVNQTARDAMERAIAAAV